MQRRKRVSTQSYLRTSNDALNHWKHAGIAVYMPKSITSKETVETIWSDSPKFWVAPRTSNTRVATRYFPR
jgi:hypothetical protein